MKEQDAAHSFKKEFFEIQFVERAHKLRENLNLVDAMRHLYNEFVAPVDDELTRLRSDLQQKDEEIVRLLDQIEYQNKSAKDDHDKIKKLEFELQQERELRKELEKDKEYLLDMVAKVMSLASLTPSARASVWQQANECLSDNAILRYK